MSFATKITIDGSDVTNYCLSYTVVDVISDFSTARIDFDVRVLDYLNFNTQSELIISRGMTTSTDVTIFKGVVSEINRVSSGLLEVKGFDKLWLLERKSMSGTYDINIDPEAGVISAIAENIIEEHGGLTADVVDSGSIFVLDKYFCLNNTLMELLEELASLVDYTIYYNPQEDKVYFRPFGYESYPGILTVGVDIVNVPEWMTDYTKLANIVTVTGDFQELETTESFVATAAQTVFTITKTPQSVKVYDNGTLVTGGVLGQSSSYDYSVDKENETITFLVGRTVGHTVEILYSYLEPIIVSQKNSASRVKYGDYTCNKYIDTIKTTADAELKVQEIIDKFGEPFVNTKLMIIKKMDIRAGMNIQVVDEQNNVNDVFTVRKIKYQYPEVIDEVTIDDEPIYQDYIKINELARRIGRLERKNQSQGNLINQRFTFDYDVTPEPRYTSVYQQSVAGDTGIYGHPVYGVYGTSKYGAIASVSFILGHPTYGVLGTSTLGSSVSSLILKKLVQGNMRYKELCYDVDFHDASSSTADFDTTNKWIAFDAAEVWYSNVLDKGTTLSYATVSFGVKTGVIKIEISSDNKATWQELTDGIRTAVTSSDGTGTYLRLTENDSSTAKLENVYYTDGRVQTPVVTLIMEE